MEYIITLMSETWSMPPSAVKALPAEDWLIWAAVNDARARAREAEERSRRR